MSGNVQAQHVAEATTKHRARVYERWQGNERFFCRGYLVAGPGWKASIGTACLIAAPTAVFLALVAPYLTYHVHVVIMVFSCILPVLSILFLGLTACRDPGVIPRQEPDDEFLTGHKPRTKEVFVNNHRVVIRYNDTCHFYQPPRAHHCSVNDNCIERFDHHCPWVGTTIGKRNYRTFLLFVYINTIYCLYVFGCCLAMLFVKHRQLRDDAIAAGDPNPYVWGKTIAQTVPAIVLMVFAFLFFWFVGGLSVFHAYLVGTNQTTYENFRYNHDNRPNPYDKGLLWNCAEVWCLPVPPSQVHFRQYIDEVKRTPPPALAAVNAGDPPPPMDNAYKQPGMQPPGQPMTTLPLQPLQIPEGATSLDNAPSSYAYSSAPNSAYPIPAAQAANYAAPLQGGPYPAFSPATTYITQDHAWATTDWQQQQQQQQQQQLAEVVHQPVQLTGPPPAPVHQM